MFAKLLAVDETHLAGEKQKEVFHLRLRRRIGGQTHDAKCSDLPAVVVTEVETYPTPHRSGAQEGSGNIIKIRVVFLLPRTTAVGDQISAGFLPGCGCCGVKTVTSGGTQDGRNRVDKRGLARPRGAEDEEPGARDVDRVETVECTPVVHLQGGEAVLAWGDGASHGNPPEGG